MAQYINKSALIAEIDRQEIGYNVDGNHSVEYNTTRKILNIINTLEVKEVDLEKELYTWRHNHFHGRRDKEASGEYLERVTQLGLAEYFFELGMATSNKAQKGDTK